MTLIADATALILLAKISALEIFADRNDICIPKLVYEEVIRGKEKGRADSILVENLVYEAKIKIILPNPEIRKIIEKLFNLRKGELEVVSLAYKTKNTILSDDKKCINTAKALGIDFIISLDVIVALWKNKIISKERALDCISRLEEYGWYSKVLIKYYKEAIK